MPTARRASPPVVDVAELQRWFDNGARPAADRRVGLEHEKIGVLDGGAPLPYTATIAPLLERIGAQGGWTRVEEDGQPIGLKRDRATVSLEPGGQFEFSDAPQASARAARAALDGHLAELAPPSHDLGITWLAVGFRPFGTLDDVPWMPKGRYRVMRAYLPTRGGHAHEMMKRTATVQANLDWRDQAECAAMVRTALGISPLVTALWAASPLVDGKPSGYQTYRAACWLDTDPDRCGLLPFAFDASAPQRLFERYTEWALDVPMFFVYRDGRYLPAEGMTFRRFLAEGFHAVRPTLDDWELHLSTLFPEARLRPHVEVRSADAGSLAMVRALPALYRGLLYEDDARNAAWKLVEEWSYEEREALRRDVPRHGLRTPVRGIPFVERCRELVALAQAGLALLGDDDATLLDPVAEIAASGRSQADRILDAYHATGGDPAQLIPSLRLL